MKLLLLFLIFLLIFLAFAFASEEGTVTLSLNSSVSWWQDAILAYGEAKNSDGLPIQNAEVKLFVDKEITCPNTSFNGKWFCVFNAPDEIKNYNVFVKVSGILNSTSLKVSPTYGRLPSGSITRVAYEEPILFQDLNGKIKVVWLRLIVW
ncbi:MAG: hypothetical protein NZ942_02985 [Candidatus Aenigmarchaeota archaeon]|nr:hypothetical protein [Candidatus Aenigmarchaeota archaeon]